MKKVSLLLAIILVITCAFSHSTDYVQAMQDVLALEAEDGRIYYGKVLGKQVVIGQDVPQGETSGILWWGNSQTAQKASLTLHYSANQDAVVYVHWGTGGQYLSLPANQTSQKIEVTLAAGENLIQVLFQYGGAVAIDKLSLQAPSFQLVTETPVSTDDASTLYFSRNARIFMGKVDAATNALSGSCVKGLSYDSGQGIQTSAHVAFQDVYAQEKGIYELVVFCAAEEGSVAEVYVAGQSYIVPVRAAQGADTYLSDDGSERPHVVLECELQAGNNEVYVRGAYNAQMSFDALKVKFICASQTTIFGDTNEDGSRDSRDLVHLKKRNLRTCVSVYASRSRENGGCIYDNFRRWLRGLFGKSMCACLFLWFNRGQCADGIRKSVLSYGKVQYDL